MNLRTWQPPAGDGEPKTRFRHAYVLKPGSHDLSYIVPLCDKIIYATDGYAEDVASMRSQMLESFEGFDAEKDLVIAVGSANLSLIAGTIITEKILSSGRKNWSSYVLGIYRDRRYLFGRMPVRPESQEVYEFS